MGLPEFVICFLDKVKFNQIFKKRDSVHGLNPPRDMIKC